MIVGQLLAQVTIVKSLGMFPISISQQRNTFKREIEETQTRVLTRPNFSKTKTKSSNLNTPKKNLLSESQNHFTHSIKRTILKFKKKKIPRRNHNYFNNSHIRSIEADQQSPKIKTFHTTSKPNFPKKTPRSKFHT